jgi:hypothetical protein
MDSNINKKPYSVLTIYQQYSNPEESLEITLTDIVTEVVGPAFYFFSEYFEKQTASELFSTVL